ncbi:hypothetical protein [Sanguibacter antarcticus]|uniref:hypothetical protein n=1 Tax=Sanguibacter antarcticus TaxID=372484 RepID=UPI000BF67516|nr:hypothetical protein [Sanguibacter antarcticus]
MTTIVPGVAPHFTPSEMSALVTAARALGERHEAPGRVAAWTGPSSRTGPSISPGSRTSPR